LQQSCSTKGEKSVLPNLNVKRQRDTKNIVAQTEPEYGKFYPIKFDDHSKFAIKKEEWSSMVNFPIKHTMSTMGNRM
jgi:hypothetical protein